MPPSEAELSSLAAQLDELGRRVAATGEALDTEDTADAAGALFEAERGLRSAARSLARARRLLG